jgi:hypothetical protein
MMERGGPISAGMMDRAEQHTVLGAAFPSQDTSQHIPPKRQNAQATKPQC